MALYNQRTNKSACFCLKILSKKETQWAKAKPTIIPWSIPWSRNTSTTGESILFTKCSRHSRKSIP